MTFWSCWRWCTHFAFSGIAFLVVVRLEPRRAEGCWSYFDLRTDNQAITPRVRVCLCVSLAGAELTLGTGATIAPAPPVPSDDLFLSPAFVQKLAVELLTDTVFGPIMPGAAEALGKLVDRHGDAIADTSSTSKGGTVYI